MEITDVSEWIETVKSDGTRGRRLNVEIQREKQTMFTHTPPPSRWVFMAT